MEKTLRVRLVLGGSYLWGGLLALFHCFMILSVTFSQLEGKVTQFPCGA